MRTVLTATMLIFISSNVAGRQNPVDSTTARQLLEEATAAFSEAPELHSNRRFVSTLAALRDAWGLPADARVRFAPSGRHAQLSAVIEEQEWDLAERQVLSAVDRTVQLEGARLVISGLVSAGYAARALAFAGRIRYSTGATSRLLSGDTSGGYPAEFRIRVVQEYLLAADVSPDERRLIEQQILQFVARYDYAAAWEVTDTVSSPSRQAWLQFVLLPDAYNRNHQNADSLLTALYNKIQALQETNYRTEMLNLLGGFCTSRRAPACAGLDLPPGRLERILNRTNDIAAAMTTQDWELAQAEVDSLVRLLTPDRLALLVLTALDRAHDSCASTTSHCWVELERWRSRWVAHADALLPVAEPSVADSLRYYIAVLLAGQDTDRSFRTASAIDSVDLKSRAFAQIAGRLLAIDIPATLEALRQAGHREGSDGIASQLFLTFSALGDTVGAASALEMMWSPAMRMRARLDWAGRLLRSLQIADAITSAMNALDEWDPSEEPMAGWRGQFNVLVKLNLYDRLIQWARDRPDAADRAAALAAVVGSVSGWQSQRGTDALRAPS